MRAGFIISSIAHVAIITLGVVSLSSPKPFEVAAVEPVPVDIIPIEELTQVVQGDEKANISEKPAPKPTKKAEVKEAENIGDTDKDVEAKADAPAKEVVVEKTVEAKPVEPAKPTPIKTPDTASKPQKQVEISKIEPTEQVEAEAEPAPEAIKLPEKITKPKVRPKPETIKPKEAKANERKVAENENDKKKTEDKKDAKKTKDKIAALINKADSTGGGKKSSSKKASLGSKKKTTGKKLSQTEMDALRGRLQQCWSLPPGMVDADELRVKIIFQLDRSGKITGKPSVKATGGSARSQRAFAGSAKRAVKRCQPYELPADKYDTWSEIEVNFSAADFL
jgi:hypothetical protein